MDIVKHAIILVAGEGTRLRPFTDTNPKCFARVGGCRILDNALDALAAYGCDRVTIVVGHLSENIRESMTDAYRGMSLRYVENRIYGSTNSMYSLHLGMAGLEEPTWVLEGDVFFDPSILALQTSADIVWFADGDSRESDGAYLEVQGGRALSLTIVRDTSTLAAHHHKSIGILKLSTKGVQTIRDWLSKGIDEGKQNLYYDLIMREHMGRTPIEVVNVAGLKWFEIDNTLDLAKANALFG